MRTRAEALERLTSERFDVVVIGGGITGAGVALDAATRGYSVALVERDDWSSGTSSRSSKMVHGGLRYLQNFDLGLVREALVERQLMVQLAPHLVKPLPFLVVAFGGARPDFRVGVGLNMYNVLAARRRKHRRRAEREAAEEGSEYWNPDRHRTIPGEEVVELLPALAAREPNAAYLFYDCQTDDSRLVLTVLGEAERFGAVCVNGAPVVELIEEEGRAAGVVCAEEESGERFVVAADNVVNATGVWADRIRPEELHAEEDVPVIRPSRGTHIIIDRANLPLEAAAIVPAGSGRTIFALPWLGQTLIGTTDNDYEGQLEHPRPDESDVEYLLKAVNRFFERELGPGDVAGAYAGVRPLIATGDPKKSVDISRRAELYETSSGMITITGGKLTTWRRMAKAVVDRLAEREFREAPCRTHEILLGHAVEPDELPEVGGVEPDARSHLASRYGLFAERVLAMCQARPELAKPIVPGLPDLLVEAAVAARHEQARSVGDVLLRRTRLGLLAARRLTEDLEPARRVAAAMGEELGWNRRRVKQEAERWLDEAAEEGLVPGQAESRDGRARDKRSRDRSLSR
jgi:glycerol-3-phosphate dehydrogenase